MKNTRIQFSKYIVIGGTAALINVGTYNFFVYKLGVNFIIASIVCYLFGVCFNYFCSKRWVFKNTYENHIHQMSVFLIIATIGLAINSGTLFFLIHSLKFSYFSGYILSTGITFFWNFTAHKLITFNNLIFKDKVLYD